MRRSYRVNPVILASGAQMFFMRFQRRDVGPGLHLQPITIGIFDLEAAKSLAAPAPAAYMTSGLQLNTSPTNLSLLVAASGIGCSPLSRISYRYTRRSKSALIPEVNFHCELSTCFKSDARFSDTSAEFDVT